MISNLLYDTILYKSTTKRINTFLCCTFHYDENVVLPLELKSIIINQINDIEKERQKQLNL